jgi:trehalose-phosphatase
VEKEVGYAWNYGFSDLKYGEWQAAECQNHMTVSLPNYPIHIMSRKRCIEVYLRNVSKATAIRRILQHHQNRARRTTSLVDDVLSPKEQSTPLTFDVPTNEELCDFIFCIGDDRSDEYMFQYLKKLLKRKSSFMNENSRKSLIENQISELSISESPMVDIPLGRPSVVETMKIFTCTVGSKSSAAQWYVPSHNEAFSTLSSLTE